MYLAWNGFPTCKLQRVIRQQIFLIHCAHSSPTSLLCPLSSFYFLQKLTQISPIHQSASQPTSQYIFYQPRLVWLYSTVDVTPQVSGLQRYVLKFLEIVKPRQKPLPYGITTDFYCRAIGHRSLMRCWRLSPKRCQTMLWCWNAWLHSLFLLRAICLVL